MTARFFQRFPSLFSRQAGQLPILKNNGEGKNKDLVGGEGFEPPAPAVREGAQSEANCRRDIWWAVRGLNPRPPRCKRDALPLS